MISRLAFFASLLTVVLLPTLGAFVVPNSNSKLTDWSMFAKPTNTSLCWLSIETSDDGLTWSPWDGRVSRHGITRRPHLYRTPSLQNEAEVDYYSTSVCRSRPNGQLKRSYFCLKEFREWVQVKQDEIVDCKNRVRPPT